MPTMTEGRLKEMISYLREHAKEPDADGYYTHVLTNPECQIVLDELDRHNLVIVIDWEYLTDDTYFTFKIVPRKASSQEVK
jgi:hypothetical protein